MGTAVGLLLGAGVLCIWLSCWHQPPARSSAWATGFRELLVHAGMPGVGPAAFLGASVAIGLAVALVLTAFTGSPPIGVCFGLFGLAAPTAYVRSRANRRRREVRTLWPDVVDDLGSGIRAGLSLPEALISLADRGPEPLRPQFAAFARDYRASGRFAECLDALKDRLADPVADRIVEALRLTRDVGGTDLGRLLRTLSQFLREDLRTRGELEARQSWTVNGARLAAGAPWLVLAMLATRPGTVQAYNSGTGVLVLVVGGVASVLAYLAMVRLGRLPEDARVLR